MEYTPQKWVKIDISKEKGKQKMKELILKDDVLFTCAPRGFFSFLQFFDFPGIEAQLFSGMMNQDDDIFQNGKRI